MRALARRAGYSLIERSLRRTFRRIVWVGRFAPPPAGLPVVLYANHHLFHDSFVLMWFIERVLGRTGLVWMEDYDRFPFFGLLGARALPAGQAPRRATTVRATARAMAADPSLVMLYFPEGRLHPAAEGVLDFPAEQLRRLDNLLPPRLWWPVALRLTGHHDAKPTVLLTGGPVSSRATGREGAVLRALLEGPEPGPDAPRRVLLEGRPGLHEREGLRFLSRLGQAERR